MSTSSASPSRERAAGTDTMRAAVFEGPNRIVLAERPIPACGLNDAIVKVTMTTICGTDVHILSGEYPVAPGRIVGHEPVDVIHELGSAVEGYALASACSSARSRPAVAASSASTKWPPSAPATATSGR